MKISKRFLIDLIVGESYQCDRNSLLVLVFGNYDFREEMALINVEEYREER